MFCRPFVLFGWVGRVGVQCRPDFLFVYVAAHQSDMLLSQALRMIRGNDPQRVVTVKICADLLETRVWDGLSDRVIVASYSASRSFRTAAI